MTGSATTGSATTGSATTGSATTGSATTELRGPRETAASLPGVVRQAYDALPYLVWAATPEGRVVFHNTAMVRYLGLTLDLFRSVSWTDHVHPDDRALSRDAWDAALRDGTSYRCEVRLRRGDDEAWRWHMTEARPVRADDGAIVRWCGSLVDVQDRHDAEDRLRESAARLRRALVSAPLPMILFTEDGDFVLVNDALLERTGYARGVLRSVDDWMRATGARSADDEPTAEPTLLDVERSPFAVGRTLAGGDFLIRTASGEERIWSFFTAPVGWGTDGRRLLVSMANDVTERKRAARRLHVLAGSLEQRVAERTRELAERTAQLRELACELSVTEQRERRRLGEVLHDHVQQLLVAAKMQLSIARRRDLEGPVVNLLAGTESLVDDTLATIRSLTAQLRPRALRDEGLGAALAWLSGQMHDRYELDVTTDLAVDAEPDDETLRVLLYEATRELLFNVVKHAGVHAAHVSLSRADGRIRLCVADEGAGFDPARNGRPTGEGGYGLDDIRARLACLGGRLDVRSSGGAGTQVEVVVPPL